MNSRLRASLLLACLPAAWLGGFGSPVLAHGGVVSDEDLCIIEIGVFRAHFTIYQPKTRASREFCEDIPDVAETVFAMDYLHDSLREVPVDFRIIRDITNRTIYASWEDVRGIADLEAVTVFYQPPVINPDASFSVDHAFSERGWYVGIVTTRHPTLDRAYQAVFGFHVGGLGWGYWPWLLVLLAGLQLQYWVFSGGFARWRARRRERGVDAH